MHKNIKTVAGCLTRVTCDITAPEGTDTTLSAYLVYEGESRPATLESAGVIIFPAVPYGHYAYEIRCGGKPVAFGHLLVRPSAFPHTDGVVDYSLEADLTTTQAATLALTLTPGPRGPKGEDGVGAEQVASIVGSTFKLAVGSGVPTASADNSSIALGGEATRRSIAVGYNSMANNDADAIAIGYQAKGYGSKGVSIGAGSWCTGERAIAIGNAADAAQNDTVAIGAGAKVNMENSFAIGKGAVANNCNCGVLGEEATSYSDFTLLLGAKRTAGDVAVTLELMANDLESVAAGSHEGGLKGDTVAFKGGALRFSLIDKLAGKRLCATVTMAQLFELLCKSAGGAQVEFGSGGYYSY